MSEQRTRGWTVKALVCAAALAMGTVAQAGEGTRAALTVEQKPLAEAVLPASELKVDVWANRADGTYRAGDDVQLYLRTSADAQVMVIAVDSEGNATIILPNRFVSDNRLAGNTVHAFPAPGAEYVLEVQPPVGTMLVKVLATSDETPILDLSTTTRAAGDFYAYQGGAQALARNIVVTAKERPQSQWASVELPLVVGEGGDGAEGGSAEVGTFGLMLRPERASYRVGESLRLQVAAERDCRLTVIHTVAGSEGVRMLYPNRQRPTVSLTSGQMSWLPGMDEPVTLEVTGPVGEHRLLGLCHVGGADLSAKLGGERSGVYATPSESELEQWLAHLAGEAPAIARVQASFTVTE